ncbi:MAG: tetratricopeptide repeat protein [Balneolaceae bacterium]
MTSLTLVFGIFFTLSCSTLSLTNESAESLYEDGKYQRALSSVNKFLEENPDHVENKILKAQILREITLEEQNPSDRKPYYQNFKNVLDEVRFTTEDYQARTDSILVNAWSFEQSEGVRYLQEDDTDTYEIHFDRIIAHLENASTIIPDSLNTYNLKATTFYRHGDTQKAISTLENAENNGVTLTPESQEKIAFLYLESGNLGKSIEIYKELVNQYSDNQEYRHGLINALILNEDHEEAVTLLKDLSDEYPNRDEYVEALASEQFFQVSQEIDELATGEITKEIVTEFVTKLEEIGELFQGIDSDRPANEDHQLRIASFYTDAGIKISSLTEYSEEELMEEISSHAEDFHRYSLPYWRQLTESYPENRDYFQKLYETYQLLEMQEEAEMLEQQINF